MTSITGNGEKEQALRKQLRKQARDLIRRGRLPVTGPKSTWGGRGSGTRCALCGSKIGFAEVEIEAEFASARGASRLDKLYFHGYCFAEFELERDRLRATSRLARNRIDGKPSPLGTPVAGAK
ncbi:MAG TPA: hypothetical protein VFM97_05420 [Gammaproteobacteria bacterium]|nr:hypothetical protein [Gammaproteobacteria bacterium]